MNACFKRFKGLPGIPVVKTATNAGGTSWNADHMPQREAKKKTVI